MTSDSKGETNFPHKLILNDTKVSRLRTAFTNSSSANIKFSKTQLSKIVKLGAFIIDEMLEQCKQFQIIKFIENSAKLHSEELTKKRASYEHKRDEKIFL